MLGGAFFCGGFLYYMYIAGGPDIRIDGVLYQARMEEGRLPTMEYHSNGETEFGGTPEKSCNASQVGVGA